MINSESIEKLEAVFQVPDNAEMIDETFYVWKTRFGCFSSMTTDGRRLLTGGTKEGVVSCTRKHLKYEQEGWPEGSVRIVNSGIVGGKL